MRKRVFLSLFLLLILNITINGQTEKSTILIGSINYSSLDLDDITFSPHVGYFVSDNLALGLNFSFLWEFGDGNADFANALAPYLKFYLGKSTRGKFFGQVKPAIALYNVQFDDIIYGIAINAGYTYFITDKLSMDYSAQLSKAKDSNTYVSLNVGLNFHLGKSE